MANLLLFVQYDDFHKLMIRHHYQSVDPALVVKGIHSPTQRGNFPPIGKEMKPENVTHILAGTQPAVVKYTVGKF